jgi:hypothetical protein
MFKKFIKKNNRLYKFLSDSREMLRIIYNTKRRSRFWTLRKGDETLDRELYNTKRRIALRKGDTLSLQ